MNKKLFFIFFLTTYLSANEFFDVSLKTLKENESIKKLQSSSIKYRFYVDDLQNNNNLENKFKIYLKDKKVLKNELDFRDNKLDVFISIEKDILKNLLLFNEINKLKTKLKLIKEEIFRVEKYIKTADNINALSNKKINTLLFETNLYSTKSKYFKTELLLKEKEAEFIKSGSYNFSENSFYNMDYIYFSKDVVLKSFTENNLEYLKFINMNNRYSKFQLKLLNNNLVNSYKGFISSNKRVNKLKKTIEDFKILDYKKELDDIYFLEKRFFELSSLYIDEYFLEIKNYLNLLYSMGILSEFSFQNQNRDLFVNSMKYPKFTINIKKYINTEKREKESFLVKNIDFDKVNKEFININKLMNANKYLYTFNISTYKNLQEAKEYFAEFKKDIMIYTFGDEKSVKIIYGLYSTVKEASEVIKHLPNKLKEDSPYIDKISKHQFLYEKYHSASHEIKKRVKRKDFEDKQLSNKKLLSKLDDGIYNIEKLLNADDSFYIINISTFKNKKRALTYIYRNKLEKDGILFAYKKDFSKVKILYGIYKSMDEAKEALKKLPENVKKQKPYIDKVSKHKNLYKKYHGAD